MESSSGLNVWGALSVGEKDLKGISMASVDSTGEDLVAGGVAL